MEVRWRQVGVRSPARDVRPAERSGCAGLGMNLQFSISASRMAFSPTRARGDDTEGIRG